MESTNESNRLRPRIPITILITTIDCGIKCQRLTSLRPPYPPPKKTSTRNMTNMKRHEGDATEKKERWQPTRWVFQRQKKCPPPNNRSLLPTRPLPTPAVANNTETRHQDHELWDNLQERGILQCRLACTMCWWSWMLTEMTLIVKMMSGGKEDDAAWWDNDEDD